jgi:hypothetical protein
VVKSRPSQICQTLAVIIQKTMHKSDLKIIREVKDNSIEFYTNKSLEPNSSYEIENCIKDRISPIKELKYKFDYWFDDNDSGYFIKDNIRIDIHYGVMMDFTFTIENKYSEIEMNKIENWIKDIYVCMLEKEKIRIENSVSNEKNQQNLELNVIEETEINEDKDTKESYLKRFFKKILKK